MIVSFYDKIYGSFKRIEETFLKGFLPRDEYLDLLSQCKLFVQFSNNTETFGIRAVEAAYFMPVVYLDNGAAPFYKHWTTVSPDEASLPTKVSDVLTGGNYDELANKCREFSLQYTLDNVLSRWSPVLKDLDKPVKRVTEDLDEWFV